MVTTDFHPVGLGEPVRIIDSQPGPPPPARRVTGEPGQALALDGEGVSVGGA
jgi:hypothetical protein